APPLEGVSVRRPIRSTGRPDDSGRRRLDGHGPTRLIGALPRRGAPLRKLARFVAGSLVLLGLLIGARRLFESAAPISPPASGERDTQVGEVRWRSREIAGTGDVPVVFVHGLVASSQSFRKVLGSAAGGRPAIAVDLPGFGDSDRPARSDQTYDGRAAVLARFLEQRRGERRVRRAHPARRATRLP